MQQLQLELGSTKSLTLDLTGSHRLSLGLTGQQINVVEVKMNTKAYWDNMISYIPKRGTIIVYTDYYVFEEKEYPAFKVGDGSAYLIDLPVVGNPIADELFQIIEDHIHNTSIHVSQHDREFWDNKLNVNINEETLELNRL